MTASARWEIKCNLADTNGSYVRELQRISDNADPETDAAFDALSPLGNPVPLPGDSEPTRFPAEVLPSVVREVVKATAEALSVPVDLAALTALGVISTAITGAVRIQLKSDWAEPANLYLVGIARSGEGKSPMMTKLAGSIASDRAIPPGRSPAQAC